MRKVKQTKPSETLGGANGRTIALVPGDIATEQDLMKLMLLMFHEPEIAVEYFSLYSEPFVPPLKAAIDRGDMFLLKSENHYYKMARNRNGRPDLQGTASGRIHIRYLLKLQQKGPGRSFCNRR